MTCIKTMAAVMSALGVMLIGGVVSAQQTNATYRYFQEDAVEPTPESSNGGSYSVGCDTGCTDCDAAGCDSCGCGSAGLFSRCCSLGAPAKLLGFECRSLDVGGWTQFGYHNRANGLFNNHPDQLNLHQQWMYMQREADGSNCCWDWGFRADLVYGVDAQDTQAFGNPLNGPGNDARRWDNSFDHGVYGWAIPQAYVQAARGNLSVIAGHFYTPIGYETVAAPENFFYSHAFTMYNSEPFTHTGVLATYALNPCTEVYAGWTLGWDTGFDRFNQGNNFLGGISRTFSDEFSLAYVSTIGDMGLRGEGYTHSLVLDFALSDNLNYVMQSDWVSLNDVNPTGNLNDTIGINNYFIYQVSDCLAFGSRLEWWKADGISMWGSTMGLNIKPHANLTFRPEARYDWGSTAGANAFGLNNDVWTFGIDAILTY